MAKEGRLKRYWNKIKQYNQDWTYQNNERKFYKRVGGECTGTYQLLDAKKLKQFWIKIWRRNEHNRKVEWINSMEKELKEFEEGPEAKIHVKSIRTTLKKVPNWKTPGHDGFGIQKILVHSRHTDP